MKKLNNRGFTLIEMLLALAILAIFMVCVTAFVASSSKSTKQTKKQVKVQQDTQEVYDTIFDSVMQATALIINTKELASGDGTASGSAVPAASSDASADARVRKSEQFDAKLAAGEEVYLFSSAAYDNIEFVKKNYEPDAAGGASAIQDAKQKYLTEHPDITISNPTGFIYTQNNKEVLNPDGNVVNSTSTKITEKKNVISMAQFWGAMAVFSLPDMEYAAFDDREYVVEGIGTGSVKISDTEKLCSTIVYDKDKKSIYLNRDTTAIDFTPNENNRIADNCTEFTIKVAPDKNSVTLKLTLSDAGYSYTVGGVVNIRNNNILK